MKMEIDFARFEAIKSDPIIRLGTPCCGSAKYTVAELLADLADGKSIHDVSQKLNGDIPTLRRVLEEISMIFNVQLGRKPVQPKPPKPISVDQRKSHRKRPELDKNLVDIIV